MHQTTLKNYGINVSGTNISNLRFADGIDLLSEDHISLQDQIKQVTKSAEEGGLMVNIKKTKTIVFGDKTIDQQMEINGEKVENVDEFEYLGSLLTWDNSCSKEIRRRINKATGAMASINICGELRS